MWLMCHDRLPLMTRLFKWGVVDNDLCVLCQTASETRNHLFGYCSFTQSLFNQFLPILGIATHVQSFDDILSMFSLATRTSSCLYRI